MKFDDLTPDELQALKEALEAKMGGGAPGGDDQASEDSRFESIAASLEAMQEKISAMDEEIDCLGKLVQEELIDKISEGVEEGRRSSGIKSLMEKHGERFGPYKEFYGQMTGGADIYEKLWEELEAARNGSEEFGEEQESGKLDELFKGLEERKSGIKGALGEEKKPEAAAVEVTKIEAEPVDSKGKIEQMVKDMKRKGGVPGMPR
jgi:hypothetical protein